MDSVRSRFDIAGERDLPALRVRFNAAVRFSAVENEGQIFWSTVAVAIRRFCLISVLVSPGSMITTRIPNGCTSRRSDSITPSSANVR